jgi:hypothetical protein
MSFRLKCCLLYPSHIVTPYFQSFYVSSINGSKKHLCQCQLVSDQILELSIKYTFVCGTTMWEIEYAYNNWQRTVWVPHLSKWIHSIHAKGPREVTRGGGEREPNQNSFVKTNLCPNFKTQSQNPVRMR